MASPKKRKKTPRSRPQTPKKSKKGTIKYSWVLWVGLIVGINLICFSGWYLLYRQTILSFNVSPTVVAPLELRGGLPLEIKYDALNLLLPLQTTTIIDGVWQTSPTVPTYLADSGRPGEGTNIVVYGHNTKPIFSQLHQAKIDDEVSIITDNNKKFTYRITEKKVVLPTEIEEVLPTKYELLTIYTCTGWLDSKRLVLKATPVRVESL